METITGASTFRDVIRISRAKFVADLAGSPAASVAAAVYDYAVEKPHSS